MLASGLSLLLPLWEPFKLLGSWPRRGGHSNPGNCLSFAAQIWRSCHVSKRQKQRLQDTEFRVRRPNLSKILPLILTSCLLLVNDLDFHKKYLFIYLFLQHIYKNLVTTDQGNLRWPVSVRSKSCLSLAFLSERQGFLR